MRVFLFLVGFALGDVTILTDSNFEHDTQAATGATTGNWFVMFYSPNCPHCTSLLPIWNKFSETTPNVATVDCTTEKSVCQRFKIRSYPTLLLFRHGFIYEYKEARDVDKFKEFADSGYEAVTPTPVKEEVGKIRQKIEGLTEAFEQTFSFVVNIAKHRPDAAVVLFMLGLISGLLVSSVMFWIFVIEPRGPSNLSKKID
eukprot:GHVL01041685.1.p1 GENE.GHVL01041685.1~~GHVL01041685.1.p1  ORF type:complete len:200 (+),score=16.88 GHVL01041685.1:53-652(+)